MPAADTTTAAPIAHESAAAVAARFHRAAAVMRDRHRLCSHGATDAAARPVTQH